MINESFGEGFKQGYRAIKGAAAAVPATPSTPTSFGSRTAFQMGIMRGIEHGKRWERGELLRREAQDIEDCY